MHPSAAKHLLLVVAAATFSFLAVITHTHALTEETQPAAHPSVSHPTCIPHERDALLAFKHGITGDPAGVLETSTPGTEVATASSTTAADGEASGVAPGPATSVSFDCVATQMSIAIHRVGKLWWVR